MSFLNIVYILGALYTLATYDISFYVLIVMLAVSWLVEFLYFNYQNSRAVPIRLTSNKEKEEFSVMRGYLLIMCIFIIIVELGIAVIIRMNRNHLSNVGILSFMAIITAFNVLFASSISNKSAWYKYKYEVEERKESVFRNEASLKMYKVLALSSESVFKIISWVFYFFIAVVYLIVTK